MNIKHRTILNALPVYTPDAITTKELWQDLNKSRLVSDEPIDMTALGKILEYLRRAKQWVYNGQSSYVNGKAAQTWLITESGIAALSVDLDNEEPDAVVFDEIHIQDTHQNATVTELEQLIETAQLNFDLNQTLDNALYRLVKLIRDVANQSIEIAEKPEKINALNEVASCSIIHPTTRSLLEKIRQDIESLDA